MFACCVRSMFVNRLEVCLIIDKTYTYIICVCCVYVFIFFFFFNVQNRFSHIHLITESDGSPRFFQSKAHQLPDGLFVLKIDPTLAHASTAFAKSQDEDEEDEKEKNEDQTSAGEGQTSAGEGQTSAEEKISIGTGLEASRRTIRI